MDPLIKKCKDSSEQSSGNAEDRISALPDTLIHHILSFLSMREVVATTLLSSRWCKLWTFTPTLDFGNSWRLDSIGIALIHYAGMKMRKFRISSDLRRFDFDPTSYVDTWIRFAMRHDMEELDLDFAGGNNPVNNDHEGLTSLNRRLFTCKSLVVLKLRFCNLNKPKSVQLHLLKTLELCYLDVTKEEMEVLTSGCPLLEDFVVEDCNKQSNLIIFAPNLHLKNLRIRDSKNLYFWENVITGIEIFAPYVLSLELGDPFRSYYKILNLSSTANAIIDFEIMLKYKYHGQIDLLMGLLRDLSHAKTLKLCGWCVQVLAVREVVNTSSLYLRSTCLELKTGFSRWDHLGKAYLLKSSHHLESLIINIGENNVFTQYGGDQSNKLDEYVFDENKFWELLELSCWFLHLKTVKIYGFMGSKTFSLKERQNLEMGEFIERRVNEVKLVRLLLKNSETLVKMIISTTKEAEFSGCPMKSELLLNLMKRLLLLPRASKNAEIVFS